MDYSIENKNMGITVPENNIELPKNDGFQQESPFPGGPHFQGIPVSFREGNKNASLLFERIIIGSTLLGLVVYPIA